MVESLKSSSTLRYECNQRGGPRARQIFQMMMMPCALAENLKDDLFPGTICDSLRDCAPLSLRASPACKARGGAPQALLWQVMLLKAYEAAAGRGQRLAMLRRCRGTGFGRWGAPGASGPAPNPPIPSRVASAATGRAPWRRRSQRLWPTMRKRPVAAAARRRRRRRWLRGWRRWGSITNENREAAPRLRRPGDPARGAHVALLHC